MGGELHSKKRKINYLIFSKTMGLQNKMTSVMVLINYKLSVRVERCRMTWIIDRKHKSVE